MRYKILATLLLMTLMANANSGNHPILIISGDKNYGLFTGEVLKTEGFNEFQITDIGDKKITTSYLQKFDVIILTENILTAKQQQAIENYVKEGGNLIAFRPDKKTNKIYGIEDSGSTIADGYIVADTSTAIGSGITSQPMQYHGEADKYLVKAGKKIASLLSKTDSYSGIPAIVENHYGKGLAIAFLYNLPQSIALTRQGNFRNAGNEMDGITGIRAMDMFTDGWVDTTKNLINQADEQMRLLSACIHKMCAEPLPRFWYFPDTLNCLVTLTNDGEDSKEEEFQPQFPDVESKDAKMTIYIKEVEYVSKDWVDAWSKKGFEISGHPDDTKQATDPDWNTMDSVYKNLTTKLEKRYGIKGMSTVTNHWFVWCGKNREGTARDFTAQAKIEEANGTEIDCNYAHYDNNSNQGHFLGSLGTNQGNYTGSGLTMKFSDEQGKIINVYQHLNNVYDQQYMENKDQEGYYNCFKGLMDRSLDHEVYSYISIKAHNNEYYFSKKPLMKMLDYAKSKNIPVWTVINLLGFLKAKDEASFSDIKFINDRLSFNIKSSLKHTSSLNCMLPFIFNGKKINKVMVNGKSASFYVKKIKGSEYAMLAIIPGANYSIAVNYNN